MLYKVPKKYRVYLEEAIELANTLQARVEDDLFPESGILKDGLDENKLQEDFNRYSILLDILRDLQRKVLNREDLSFLRTQLADIDPLIEKVVLVIEPVRRFKVSKPMLHQFVLDKSFRTAIEQAKSKDSANASSAPRTKGTHN